jgi:hypothetical protein
LFGWEKIHRRRERERWSKERKREVSFCQASFKGFIVLKINIFFPKAYQSPS